MNIFFVNTLAIVAFIFLIVYVLLLIRQSQKRLWNHILALGIVGTLVLGLLVHIFIFINVSDEICAGKWYAISLMSIVSTLEMFVGGTKMFDNGIHEFLFGNPIAGESSNIVALIGLTTAYISALITTIYIIGMFFIRHLSSRSWLKMNKPTIDDEVFILFGMNAYVRCLIKDLKRNHSKAMILAVDYLTDDEKDIDVSLLERIRAFFTHREELVEGATIVLKAKKNLALADPCDICGSIGLKHLRPYLDNPRTKIFLLLDNQDENIAALNNLFEAKVECSTIYCHARRDDLNAEIEEAFHQSVAGDIKTMDWESVPEVVFIDSSYLAVRSLLRSENHDKDKTLPIYYVKIANDKNGQCLGYVESGFKAMILGFGETGQEALSFLYEYGAFVGKDKMRAPFECHVYDNRMDSIIGAYKVTHPCMNPEDAGVYYHNMEIGNDEFRDSFEKEIKDTNYIVICGGTDEINLRIVQFVTQHLGNRDTSEFSRFRILVRMYNPNSIVLRTLESIKKREKECIQFFGEIETIWIENVISDEQLTNDAKSFHYHYLLSKYGDKIPDELQWDTIEEKIHGTNVSREDRLNGIRMRAQNYSNYLHIPTKLKLMQGPLLDNAKSIAECIPSEYVDTMFNGDKKTKDIIEYVAICEHLRWEASHVVLGYRSGNEKNIGLKIHPFIMDYSKLAPEYQLFDWEVVKTTLEWYASNQTIQ